MTIAILCPTRARNKNLHRMLGSAQRTSTPNNVIVYIGFTQGMEDGAIEGVSFPDGMPTAFKWNLLANIALNNTDTKLFMLGSDDMEFTTPGWDKALLEHYNSLENKIHVYHLQDSRDKDGTPHPIVTREYIEKMGFFLPPIFLHWIVDAWTVEIAKSNNCFTHLRDYELRHIKPSDQGKPDETHSLIRKACWNDRDMWVAESCKDYLDILKKRLA